MSMRTIRLYGVLRRHFGREYRLDVHSVRDAVNALCQMIPGFERFLCNAHERGLVFSVFCGKRNASEQELDLRGNDDSDIRIAPIIQGSKSGGLFQTIIGATLIALSAWNPLGWTATTTNALMAAGIANTAGGVVQMLAPTANIAGGANNEDGNNPSYGFGAAVTTVAQGNPYPLLYGEREIGGAIESGGIYTQDQL